MEISRTRMFSTRSWTLTEIDNLAFVFVLRDVGAKGASTRLSLLTASRRRRFTLCFKAHGLKLLHCVTSQRFC